MPPWEKYQGPQGSGPWSRYGTSEPPTVEPPQQGNWLGDTLGRVGQSFGSALTGAGQGFTMGAYDEVAAALGTPIKAAENLMNGTDSINGLGDVGSFLGRSFLDAREGQQALVNQAYEQAPIAAATGDVAGALGLGLLAGGSNVASLAKPTIGGMAARGALEGGAQGAASGFNAAEDPTLGARVRAAGQGAVSGALLGGVTGGVVGSLASRAQTAAVDSVDDLKNAARDIYEFGRASGIAATPVESRSIADSISNIARSENVILPNGKVNTAYAPLAGIMDTIDAYAGRNVSVGEIQKIRDTIRDVVANPEPGVQRIALNMLDEFNDNYAYRVFPELAEADDLYWRAKTGELIEKLGKLATVRSGQYTQSGMENALRAEFRALERQIINGRVKGLPDDLVQQISSISQGDDLQNAARWASRFSLRNPLTSIGGTAAGFATGSLPVAMGVWGTAQGAGLLAEKMARDKFSVASALARNGGPLAPVDYTPLSQALVQGAGNVGGRFAANF